MENDQIDLSIVIPTYNRAVCLRKALESIIGQIPENGVEILVCSNASTDGTDTLMREYCDRHPFIRYLRNEKNLGIDGNIHRCAREAKGDYVHLMSDDDILMDGALVHLLDRIRKYPEAGFFFLNIQGFKEEENFVRLFPSVFAAGRDLAFEDRNAFVEYIWVYATFMSSFVFRNDLWNSVEGREQYIGTHIYLSYVLFEILGRCRQMVFVGRRCIAVGPQFTGSYKIFYAFAFQWRKLLLEHAAELGYDRRVMEGIYRRTIRKDLVKRVYAIKTGKVKSPIDWKSLRYIWVSTRSFADAWIYLYPLLLVPGFLLKMARGIYGRLSALTHRMTGMREAGQ